MIQKLKIANFKSIRNLELDCKKLNVFIGEPNSGKSNLLESLAFLTQGVMEGELSKEILRYKSMGDFFYDSNINKPIEVSTGVVDYKLSFAMRDQIPENQFKIEVWDVSNDEDLNRGYTKRFVNIDHKGKVFGILQGTTPFRLYQFKRLDSFSPGYSHNLIPPFGTNLPTLLLGNEEYRKWVEEFMEEKGFILTIKPAEMDINMSKFINKTLYSYPYTSISETLQRIIFYNLAIKSNADSIILLDEPESNTFPFYTKYLAERIALDNSNQFFISTHNPYLLLNIIEKTPQSDLSVNICYLKNYETKVATLKPDQIKEVLDFNSDVFFNLDRILD